MADFEIPQDIAALDDAALAASTEEALAQAASFDVIDDADLTDDHIERLSALADFITAARQATTERAQAAIDRAERISAVRAATRPDPAPAPEDEVIEAEIVEDEPAPAPEEAEPVAASAPRRPVVAKAVAAGGGTSAAVIVRPTPTLTASADVPGFATGGRLDDLETLGEAMLARMKGLPTTRMGGKQGTQARYSVGNIDLHAVRTEGLSQTDFGDDMALVAHAAREARLPGGALTAAGGWCAPSTTLYDLCSLESTDGLLDLPTIRVTRGGIRYTKGPKFSDVYGQQNAGWWLTEAQVIAGTPAKTCIDVSCPPFTEVRLDAVGMCVRAPLLTQSAYPELVRRWIELVLIAHQHTVDATILTKIKTGSTAITVTGTSESAVDSLAQLEEAANWVRQSTRMSFGQTLEVLLPYWYKTTIRADLARRGGVDLLNVSDAQIQSYFTNRKLSVQWLYNLQPLAATSPVVTPTTATVLMYPAGTWVKGSTDVINLDAVYDSTNLMQNQYTALFAEEGVLVANTCFDSYSMAINTCPNGKTGAMSATTCVLAAA